MEEKGALVTLRPGWKPPWSSTGAQTRMREKDARVKAGPGGCAQHRRGAAAGAGVRAGLGH